MTSWRLDRRGRAVRCRPRPARAPLQPGGAPGAAAARQGHWDEAQRRLHRLVERRSEPGQLTRLTLPPLGRLLARRGDGRRGCRARAGLDLALRNGSLAALAPAGSPRSRAPGWPVTCTGRRRRSRPASRPDGRPGGRRRARRAVALPGARRRAGRELPGLPADWAAGLAGSWREAADQWGKIGDPYERALELADSAERSGVPGGARRARRAGRSRGRAAASAAGCGSSACTHVPRGRTRAPLGNPAGLTERQVDVLALLATGLTNAEIAERPGRLDAHGRPPRVRDPDPARGIQPP